VSCTTRVLDAAIAAGVKQFIITSSMISLIATDDFWKDITMTEKCESLKQEQKKKEGWIWLNYEKPCSRTAYNPQTVEDALKPGAPGVLTYAVAKNLTDLAVRDLKRARPDLDLTTIYPSYVYGPVGTGQVYDSPAMATNKYIYELIAGVPDRPVPEYDPTVQFPPLNVDVRDVARAHVLALKVSPSDTLKRFIVHSSNFTWKEAVELLGEARPELKGRLPVITGNEPAVPLFSAVDTSATEAILGLKNYIKWQDTVLDTIDDMLRIEKELSAAAQ
jgi:nucleoside-diphosphate-sugar epimerase